MARSKARMMLARLRPGAAVSAGGRRLPLPPAARAMPPTPVPRLPLPHIRALDGPPGVVPPVDPIVPGQKGRAAGAAR